MKKSHLQRTLALATTLIMPAGACLAGKLTTALPGAGAQIAILPLSFEPNRGQTGDPNMQFIAHGDAYALELKNGDASLHLAGTGKAAAQTIRLQLEGARAPGAPVAEEPLAGHVNYLVGNDPTRWLHDVPVYARVRYADVYQGVDVAYYGNQHQLEYDFIVAAGADPTAIRLRFAGANRVQVDAAGNLALGARGQDVVFKRPVAYQRDGARMMPVTATYRIEHGTVRFELGRYDHSKPIVIDPVLSYVGYLGGSATDYAGGQTGYYPHGINNSTQAAAVDGAGNLYVVGNTNSVNFPLKNSIAAPAKLSSSWTMPFVTKIAPDGKSIVYSTYVGGSVIDIANGIAVDSAGSAYITGTTESEDFPVTAGAFQTVCGAWQGAGGARASNCSSGGNTGNSNAFVVKLSASGGALAYSTYLGGFSGAAGEAIAVDPAGRAYVAGVTSGNNCDFVNGSVPSYYCFPTTAGALLPDAPASNPTAAAYGFISVFNASGSSLVYSTLFGDSRLNATVTAGKVYRDTYGTAVAVDGAGNFYLGGNTASSFLPTTSGAWQSSSSPLDSTGNIGGVRGYVAKFSPAGGASAPTPVYVSYIGGQDVNDSSVAGIAADASGAAYISGATGQHDFPVTSGAYQKVCETQAASVACQSVYVAKLKPDGSAPVFATYIGGQTGNLDLLSSGGPIAIDGAGNSYVVGVGYGNLPQVPAQPANGGSNEVYVAKLDGTGSNLLYATLLTPLAGSLSAQGLAIDPSGAIYVVGNTNAANSLAVTNGAFQATYGGGQLDVFVAKILPVVATSTSIAATPNQAAAGASVTLTATVTPAQGTIVPTGTVVFHSGTTTLGSALLSSSGVATLATTALAVGSDSVTAAYSGDAGDSGSTSAAATVTITPVAVATTTTLSATPSKTTIGAQVTLTATVTPASGSQVPTGKVTFAAGGTTLGTVALGNGGTASYTTTALAAGSDAVTAAYGGDSGDDASTSAPTNVTVTPGAPTGVTASGGNAQVTLSWSPVTGAVSYSIYQGTSTGGEGKSAVQSVTSGTTATVTGLANGTTYYFTVVASAGGAAGAASSEVSATPQAPVTKTGGGGGGAFDSGALIALASLWIVRRRAH